MSIEYRLTLAGDIPLDDVAQLAAPDATETATLRVPSTSSILVAAILITEVTKLVPT